MSKMNAAVTAENRPDSPTGWMFWLYEREETHKNKGGVQIFIVHLLEIFVMLGDFFFKLVVETGPKVRATILLQLCRPQCIMWNLFRTFESQEVSASVHVTEKRGYLGWATSTFEARWIISEVGRRGYPGCLTPFNK